MKSIKSILLPAGFGAVILYFSYHALAGEQGLANWTVLQSEETKLKSELSELEFLRESKSAALMRLRDGSIDLDYLEEIARTRLSYARADEIIVSAR